jgi:5-methyltetrahydropteroyltriglutamate--homocysteine methyltransferase
MAQSIQRIRATHTGSMPRPPEILAFMRRRAAGEKVERAEWDGALSRHVDEIVRRQVAAGIDIVNDGECSKTSFMNYVAERLAGFEGRGTPSSTGPINPEGRDAKLFPDYYDWVLKHNPFADIVRTAAPRAAPCWRPPQTRRAVAWSSPAPA